ncbi:MAG: purine-nucleoside phosphorylase [Eubacteriales bacterium]|nr:purine-nucleoside phosphorylase [Eubacteriales bacterium]
MLQHFDFNKSWKELEEASAYLRGKIKETPKIALILGSSLGSLADEIEDRVEIPYREVPHMLTSTAPGHKGIFIFGHFRGKPVVAMSGRFHYYEGYSESELAFPVRLLKLLGVEILVLTNAAGCVNESWKVGDVMIITDHINLMGLSPMRGTNFEQLGERFFDVSEMYDPNLQLQVFKAARELGSDDHTHCGVYFFMPGPHYETPAEIRAIRILGGDAVGMSTVTEALTAAHCGIKTVGLSFLTNMAAGMDDEKLSDAGVVQAAAKNGPRFQRLMARFIENIKL